MAKIVILKWAKWDKSALPGLGGAHIDLGFIGLYKLKIGDRITYSLRDGVYLLILSKTPKECVTCQVLSHDPKNAYFPEDKLQPSTSFYTAGLGRQRCHYCGQYVKLFNHNCKKWPK